MPRSVLTLRSARAINTLRRAAADEADVGGGAAHVDAGNRAGRGTGVRSTAATRHTQPRAWDREWAEVEPVWSGRGHRS